MAQSKITLIGLENYLNPDHSVFENMMLPEGIDKDILIGSIILRCQEFELLYSDPEFMIAAVNVWSRKNYWTFDKWIKLINKSYDPLFNKDYFEEWTDTHAGDYSKSGSGSSSGETATLNNLTNTTDMTRTDNIASTNDVTNTHSEKAYNNESTFVETTKDVTDQDQTQTGTVKNTGTVTDTGRVSGDYSNRNNNSESGDDAYTNNHSYHGYGNIGITSAQELFMKETDVARWNMYEHIADLFANEFCIMVY